MMRHLPTLLLFAALCAFARSGESAEEHLNSCDLLTTDEVAAAFGQPFEEGGLKEYGTGPDENYFSICVFSATNAASAPTFSITAKRVPSITDPAATLQEQIDEMRESAMPDLIMEPVPELGEGAAWLPDMGQLIVLRPGAMVTLGVVGSEAGLPPILQLATIALDQLPQD